VRILFPSLDELEAATKPRTLNTSLAGIHNEGVPMKRRSLLWIDVITGLIVSSTSWRSCFKGSDGIASRKNRGTRQSEKAQPNTDEYELDCKPGKRSARWKAPRPANACRTWRSLYSNLRDQRRSTLMKTGSRDCSSTNTLEITQW
jgi:hypothetical protein